MNAPAADNDRFWQIVDTVCSATPLQEELDELAGLLQDDPEAQRLYLAYCQLHASLGYELRGRRAGKAACELTREEIQASEYENLEATASSPPLSLLSTALHGTIGFFSQEIPFALLIATVVTSLGLLLGSMIYVTHHQQLADTDGKAKPMPTVVPPKMEYVGQVTGMIDVHWADESTAALDGAGVPLGRKYAIASGLMEITYNTGAKVILQGPCTYQADSPVGGFLSLGKLTARLEKKGPGVRGQGSEKVAGGQGPEKVAGGQWSVASEANPKSRNPEIPKSQISNPQSLIPNPLFAVRTPSATVTDLGTEFGVEVAKNGRTLTHVFRGSVQLQAKASDGKTVSEVRILQANASACVEMNTEQGVKSQPVLHPIVLNPRIFRRHLLPQPKTVDLLDIVAGGNGLGHHRDRGIDPTTGQEDPQFVTDQRSDDGKYHLADAYPLIDGVFLPNGRRGPVQVDSVGHTFGGLPKTDGQTLGSIWARTASLTAATFAMQNNPARWVYAYNFDHYMPKKIGFLGLPSNTGITFDLQAVRDTYEESMPVCFAAQAGKVGRTLADLWVLVDGRLVWKSGHIQAIGALPVRVKLQSGDRFLTLITTDGGDGHEGDWAGFGDPVLEMKPLPDDGPGRRVIP